MPFRSRIRTVETILGSIVAPDLESRKEHLNTPRVPVMARIQNHLIGAHSRLDVALAAGNFNAQAQTRVRREAEKINDQLLLLRDVLDKYI